MIIPKQVLPFCANFWLEAGNINNITQAYQSIGLTASGTSGTNTLTASATVTLLMFVGQTFQLNGTDTYVVSSLSGSTITTTTNLTTTYSSATITSPCVSQWNDTSGKSNNAFQSTAANQPTYVATSQLNNKPALGFNSTNNYLLVNSSSYVNNIWTNGGTMLLVFYARTFGQVNGRLIGAANSGWFMLTQNTPRLLFSQQTSSPSTNAQFSYPVTYNITNVVALTYNAASVLTPPVIYLNSRTGASMTLQNAGGGPAVADTGQQLAIGSTNTGTRTIDGDIAVVGLWNYVVAPMKIAQMVSYMGNKYGATIS